MIDPSIPTRIQKIYNTCNDYEKDVLKRILWEIAEYGDSKTYEDIWLADYKEIPVDIDTFLTDDLYLGRTNRNGQAVYPFWKNTMHEIFDNGNKYEEVFFTGATRIGKSSTAVTCTAYMLYKLMCLKDPQQYFGKKDISKFSILFFNITKDLARGVAFREFNDTLRASPWFCLRGDTEVFTSRGFRPICELEGEDCQIYSYDPEGGVVLVQPSSIEVTGYTDELLEIELEDGTVIAGTPNHRILLSDGSYKRLDMLQEGDDIMNVDSEIFVPIPGYEDIYEISTLGNIRNVSKAKNAHRKYNVHKYGYDSIDMSKNTVKSVECIPELMMRAFFPHHPSDQFHLVGDIHDNSLKNIVPGRRNLSGVWRDVPGTDGVVQVDEYGNLYCHTYKRVHHNRVTIVPEHEIRVSLDFDGYEYVNESILKEANYHFVHRVVAAAFFGSNDDKCVNHKDGDKRNNHVSNLEYCTIAENYDHAVKLGLITYARRQVIEHTTGKLFKNVPEAASYFKVSDATVKRSINNTVPTQQGLQFSYYES